ncbi:MFS transporter [Kineococcus sp. SYSU DK002]|uniref:MFS transporter n=1 Tax=Kineococcus sp. SYSU DK002 TaxID=3383123 RepID=UPI003D7E7255
MTSRTSATRPARAAFATFAAFGVFWGTWGAALPAVRDQAGLSPTQLGTTLVLVGAGAAPAMALTGRLVDRAGPRVAAPLVTALGLAGLLVATGARGPGTAALTTLLVGATSGAADVAANSLAGQAEHRTGRPVLTRAHGVFSLAVVASSLGAGALLSAGAGLTGTFAASAAAVAALAVVVRRGAGARPVPTPAGPAARRGPLPPLLALGVVGALAFATENGHQSWGAVLVTDRFGAAPGLAATAPATFAAGAALARLTLAPLSRSHPTALLLGGGLTAAAGSVTLALAPTVPVALAGLVVAALGTAPLFPTLLSRGLRAVPADQHGRATSAVSTTAYLGFLLGPAYVGFLAGAADLRTAVLGVAALAVVFTLAAAPVSRWAGRGVPTPRAVGER